MPDKIASYGEPHRPELFRSAAWLNAWAVAWPQHNSPDHSSSGISIQKLNAHGLLHYRSASPIGTSTPGFEGFASEYLCFPDEERFDAFLKTLDNLDWHQAYFRGVLDNSFEVYLLQAFCRKNGYQLLRRDEMVAYGVDTSDSCYETYLTNLSKSTRDRVSVGRRRLEKIGHLSKDNLWPDIDGFLSIINAFHISRWGVGCFVDKKQMFIKRLLEEICSDEGEIDLSVLQLDGVPISSVLDVTYKGRTYNIQSGFSEKSFGRVSLGMIHFGFQIENAFLNPLVKYYDFMAGNGKNGNYKSSIADSKVSMGDYYVVRSAGLKLAYRLNDALKKLRGIRQSL